MTKITSAKLNKANEQIKLEQKSMDYDTRDYPIEFIVQKFSNNSYFIPQYQRNKVWSQHQKERFIESLLLGYPIPLIFLAQNTEGRQEIVDGVQRITTLAAFINDTLILKNLDKLTSLNGFKFTDLPLAEQRKLNDKALRIIVLSDKTELETRIDLFNRLNTSAEKANDSEVRSGVYSSNEFQIFIEKLSKKNYFTNALQLSSKKTVRKEDIELISRFFAYSNNYKNFKHSVKEFITNYIVFEGASWNQKKASSYTNEFENAFEFGNHFFKQNFLKNKRNQTPRVRFEAIMVGINLALRECPNLSVDISATSKLLSSKKFITLTTSDASNSAKKVRERIEFVRDYLLSAGDCND